MDSKLQVIQENTDLDEKEARLALDLANENIEEALNMVEYVEKPFFTLHIKFEKKGHSNPVYGLISLLCNGRNGDLLSLNVVATYDRDILDVGLDISNEAFEQTINQIKDESSSAYDDEIKQFFYNEIHSADIFELFTMTKEDEIRCIEVEIEDILNDIFNKAVEVNITANLLTKMQVEQTSAMIETDVEETEEDEETKIGLSIYLKCAPIISAVKGTRAKDLEVGDQVLVRIIDKREIGSYLANLLSSGEDSITSGVVNQVHLNEKSNRYTIMIEFGPEIHGKLLVDSEVKLALAEDLQSNEKKEAGGKEKEIFQNKNLNLSPPILFLFVALLFLIVILVQSI
jgi:hypothetical protein